MVESKLSGYDFFSQTLKSPKYVVAPMVEQSELAWRLLSRKFGAQLTFTPMFHAKQFLNSEQYRAANFIINEADAPLIVQFCANDATTFVEAAKLVQKHCVAVDLNLGCPQHIAKRGHYGSFLQDDWETIKSIVSKAHNELEVPITVKIRVFKDPQRTLEYVKMLVDAGAQMLTVHGRLREQKGHLTGKADWNIIKLIKESVSVPVIANGNILYHSDIHKCINETGVDGVMSAEGNLYNCAIFEDKLYACWYIAEQYLNIIDQFKNSATASQIKAHLFKIYHKCLSEYPDLREKLGQARELSVLLELHQQIKERLISEFGDQSEYTGTVELEEGLQILPTWVAQPYIRKALPVEDVSSSNTPNISDKNAQKLLQKRKRQEELRCNSCSNVKSPKCLKGMCKGCCKKTGESQKCPH